MKRLTRDEARAALLTSPSRRNDAVLLTLSVVDGRIWLASAIALIGTELLYSR